MENYIVSARKYRPSTFSSVVGQKALTATLKNAIATDRLAHAYLFCGSRGVGKTSCARIFAKTINCQNPTKDGDPCNECESCRAFNENRSLNIIELDAASNNGVDDIRQLVEQVQVPPTDGRYRVFIIDEVHMLSAAAFNAFLKTLEEPPSYVVFVLATTEKQKIIPTILSRCQIYDFNRITVSDIVDHLEYVASQEGINTERAALGVIAAKADGAMRDALSIFDQVAASSRGNITYATTIENLNVLDEAYYTRLVEAFIAGDVTNALLIYKEVRDHGFDSHFFVNGLAAYLRDLMVARTPETLSLLDTGEEQKQRMAQLAAKVPIEFFFKAMSLCNDADLHYREASSKTFLVELLLIKLCQLLSPSPIFSGDGEGQLKPIAANPAPAVTQAPARPAPTATQATAHSVPSPHGAPTQSAPQRMQSPPTPHAPAAAPVSTPPPPPAAGARRGLRSTFSSSHADHAKAPSAQSADSAPSSIQRRSASYTDDQIQQGWDSYAAARPAEHVLVNTMRACRPMRTSGDTFNVVVENEIQLNGFNDIRNDLLLHLRNTVGNDNVQLTFSINTSGPAPRIWNDREIFSHLAEDPAIAAMIDRLGLTLL